MLITSVWQNERVFTTDKSGENKIDRNGERKRERERERQRKMEREGRLEEAIE